MSLGNDVGLWRVLLKTFGNLELRGLYKCLKGLEVSLRSITDE